MRVKKIAQTVLSKQIQNFLVKKAPKTWAPSAIFKNSPKRSIAQWAKIDQIWSPCYAHLLKRKERRTLTKRRKEIFEPFPKSLSELYVIMTNYSDFF
jgi:hypothetical protein